MKKTGIMIVGLLLAVTLVLTGISGNAAASSSGGGTGSVAPGTWSEGSEININLDLNPPPNVWVQQLGSGVEVTGKTRICHNFFGGRFGWTANIYRLKSGTWQKLPTTLGWDSTEEGNWVACAMAPAAGKYAMFGYWTKPTTAAEEPPAPDKCAYDTSGWEVGYFGDVFPTPNLHLYGLVPELPLDTPFTYTVITGHANLTISTSGSGVVALSEGPNTVYFNEVGISILGAGTAVIRLSGGGCSRDITWNFLEPGV